jgi:cation diffusion facilitator family transporter
MRPQVIITATMVLDAALFAVNLAVAIMTGSRAVLSQAVYVISDLIGGLLLVGGFVASQRPADHDHPFGYGKERFFWAFTASLLTFTVAGIVVIVPSIGQISNPGTVSDLGTALVVVAATGVVSVIGIAVTLRELRRGQQSLATFLESSHQGLKMVFYQDVVSVFGSLIALVGLVLVAKTHSDAFDGVSALGVGALLLVTGFLLAAETRELLVGKAILPEEERRIFVLVERDPRVRKVRGLQSMMLGPDDVLVALRVNFQDGLTTDQIETAIDQISISLRESFPALRHLLIEPES